MQNNSISLRTALESHGNTVPSILISRTSLAHVESSAYTIYYSHDTVGVGTVEEARQITDKIIELGADQVNFVMTVGPAMFDPLEARKSVLTLEQLNAIVETAHDQDTLVVGQALFPEEAFVSIEAGVDQLTAWPAITEPMSNELLTAIVSHSVPVLSGFSVGTPFEGDVRRFLDAGGTLVFGTFAPHSGATPPNEFRLMELHGMTPMEMIQSATVNAADALEIGELVGTLGVGKQADIIVVDGDLLKDGFVTTIGKVVYVVKNGELVVQPE